MRGRQTRQRRACMRHIQSLLCLLLFYLSTTGSSFGLSANYSDTLAKEIGAEDSNKIQRSSDEHVETIHPCDKKIKNFKHQTKCLKAMWDDFSALKNLVNEEILNGNFTNRVKKTIEEDINMAIEKLENKYGFKVELVPGEPKPYDSRGEES